ncbi:gephyrin-like molybdotransferase Glp [Nitrincola sp.]|uniref:molybdopterin molybdotransferase MoeA n=1 Tax=Nitrincola sp. TaxID=1926584 RepID=UPI003A8D61EF
MRPTDNLMPVDQALSAMLQLTPLAEVIEQVAISKAAGRVLAKDIQSTCDVPPADNSSMDGYALRLADAGAPLPISQRVAAGRSPGPLTQGTCARIFTGAEIPPGADAVVMQEAVSFTAFDDLLVPEDLKPGQNIRRAGQDIRRGATILKAGTRLDYRHLGLLASVGIAELAVFRKVSVAILSTGDELVQPGKALQPGQIYNSNRFLLQGFLEALGAEVVSFEQVGDTYAETQSALRRAADQADLVLSTGGVSVGEEDHIKPAVESLGELAIWRLAMKPGKPVAFGRIDQSIFIGLPGNPVSTFVGAQVFVKPVLARLAGEAAGEPDWLTGLASFSAATKIRQEYLRVQATWQDDHWQLNAYPNQNSGVLTSAIWANALAVLPPESDVAPGDKVRFFLYADQTTPKPDNN